MCMTRASKPLYLGVSVHEDCARQQDSNFWPSHVIVAHNCGLVISSVLFLFQGATHDLHAALKLAPDSAMAQAAYEKAKNMQALDQVTHCVGSCSLLPHALHFSRRPVNLQVTLCHLKRQATACFVRNHSLVPFWTTASAVANSLLA